MDNKEKGELLIRAAMAAQGTLPAGWLALLIVIDATEQPKAQTHIISPLADVDTISSLRHMAEQMEKGGTDATALPRGTIAMKINAKARRREGAEELPREETKGTKEQDE